MSISHILTEITSESICWMKMEYINDGNECYLKVRSDDKELTLNVNYDFNCVFLTLKFINNNKVAFEAREIISASEYNTILSLLEDKYKKSIAELTLGQFHYMDIS